MAKRIAQVDIKINGINSIGEMEAKLATMNEQVKKLDVNSKAFKTMSAEIAGLQDQLKNANTNLEGVTSTEKAEGILKLGEGFAGALIGVQGLSTALGGTNEELQETIQKVGGLILAMDGLRRVTEAFSAENLKRLKGVGRSFQTLSKTVKAASLAMRASLIATGIGALLVAVGLLIANWERVTAIVTNSARNRQLKKEVQELEKVQEAQKEIVAGAEAEATARKELVEYNQNAYEAARAAFKAQVENLQSLQNEYNLNQKNLELLYNKREGINENRKKYKELTLEIEKALALQKQLGAEFELAGQKLNQVGGEMNNITKITANEAQQKAVENLVKEMGGLEFTQRRSYELELQKIDLQVKAIELTKQSNGEYRKGQLEQLDALKAERKALEGKEALRIRDIKLQLDEIDRGKEYELNQRSVGIEMEKNQIILEEMLVLYDEQLTRNEEFVATKERELDLQRYMYEQVVAAYPFDQKGLEILEERLGFRKSEIDIMSELQGIEGDISQLSFKTKLVFKAQVDEMVALFDAKTEVLNAERETVKQNIKALELQQDLNSVVEYNANARKVELEAEREIYRANLDKAKTLEEQLKWKTKVSQLDAEILAAEDSVLDAQNEQANIQNEISGQKSLIRTIDQDQLALEQQRANTEKQISYEIEQQLRLSERLKTFTDEYNQEIQAGIDVVNAWFGLASAQYDELARKADERLKKAQKELAKLNKQQEKAQDRLKDLQDELKDADGERYNELLDLIKEEQDAQGQGAAAIEAQILKQQELEKQAANDKMKAEYEKAKMEKRQALINAAINTALAVIKALPNIVLAAAVGIAGGLGIAAIAAQKIPEPEYLAKGGLLQGKSHTEGGIPVGSTGVEVEGGEYVVNKRATAEYLPLLEALNAQGNRKMAVGGQLTPVSTDAQQAFIDYDRLAEAILNGIQPKVAVVDIITGMNKVKLIQSNASL